MRVVVCDDDKLFINQLKEMLSDMSYVNSCEVFNDRIGLWNTLHTGIITLSITIIINYILL